LEKFRVKLFGPQSVDYFDEPLGPFGMAGRGVVFKVDFVIDERRFRYWLAGIVICHIRLTRWFLGYSSYTAKTYCVTGKAGVVYGRVAGAVRGAAGLGGAVPRSATKDTFGTAGRSGGILGRTAAVVALAVEIVAPLSDVAVHIV